MLTDPPRQLPIYGRIIFLLRRPAVSLCAFASTSCTSQMLISVNPPEARIVALPVDGGTATPLGSAEVTLDRDFLTERELELPLVIKASAAGRESLGVLVTTLPSSETRVSVRLEQTGGGSETELSQNSRERDGEIAQKESVAQLNDPRQWNANVRLILEAERYLNQKDPERAREIARRLQETTPWLAIAYVLEGTSYFMEKDLPRARSAVERAAKLDPQDLDTLQFLQTLDQLLQRPPEAENGAAGAP